MRRHEQLRLSLIVVATICLTSVVIAVLARATPIIPNQTARDIALHKMSNGYFLYNHGFVDDGDYVLVDQIPNEDFSRGGVYFIGASEMNTSLMTWTLPAGERRLIHNYSIGDFRHTEVGYLIRMLVEEWGLLQAGGEKTTIVLGLSPQLARGRTAWKGPSTYYVKELFTRHGQFTYDWEKGIHRVRMSALEGHLRLERDRAGRFLRTIASPRSHVVNSDVPFSKRVEILKGFMVGDWESRMEKDVRALADTIDYLQERKVRVLGILHPKGSWQDALPYRETYLKMIRSVLEARRVPIVDHSEELADSEFVDHTHARYSGHVKLHAMYRELALKALADMGTAVEQ